MPRPIAVSFRVTVFLAGEPTRQSKHSTPQEIAKELETDIHRQLVEKSFFLNGRDLLAVEVFPDLEAPPSEFFQLMHRTEAIIKEDRKGKEKVG